MNKKILILILILMVIIGLVAIFVVFGKNDREKSMVDEKDSIQMNDGIKGEAEEETMDEIEKEMKAEIEILNEGPMAAKFSLEDLEGNIINLSDYEGEKVYLKFWASWCPICLSGLEEVDNLSKEELDFKVITIVSPSSSGEMESEEFKEWFRSLEFKNITVLLDEDGKIAREYMVRAYPTSSYIGSDGVLVKSLPGHLNNDGIKEYFKGIK